MYVLTLGEFQARDLIRDAGFDDSQSVREIAIKISSALQFSFSSKSKYNISLNDRDCVSVKVCLEEEEGHVCVPIRFPPAVAGAPEGRSMLRFRLVQARLSLHFYHVLREVAFRMPKGYHAQSMDLTTGRAGMKGGKTKYSDLGGGVADGLGDYEKCQSSPVTERRDDKNKKARKYSRGSGIVL